MEVGGEGGGVGHRESFRKEKTPENHASSAGFLGVLSGLNVVLNVLNL